MIAKYDTVEVFDSLKEVSAGFVRRFYTEEGLHRPDTMLRTSGGTTAPWYNGTVLFSASDYVPRKGEEWSVLRLDVGSAESDAVLKACFVCLTKDDDDPYSKYYGWVDSAEIITGAGPSTTVLIRWHLDYYLTFMAGRESQDRITLGAGRVKRMSWKEIARPDPSQPRMWLLDDAASMIDARDPHFDTETWWAIMCTTKTSGDPPDKVVTDIVYYFWPIGEQITGAAHNSPNWTEIYTGQIEEELGIDPSRIQGFWLAPFKPWNGAQVKDFTSSSVYELTSILSGNTNTKTLADSVQTDDNHKIIFTDPTGAEMFTAPWGIAFKTIVMWYDIGTSSAVLHVYLGETDTPITERKGAEGRLFSFPLPSLPVTENAWSSYNYSGQREYDLEQKAIQRDQSAVNGIAGIGTQAIGGAIAGSAAAPGAGTVAGAVAGLVSGIIGAGVNYYTAGEFDNRSQRSVDTLTSKQTAGMLINAGGYYGLIQPYGSFIGWNMLTLVRDSQSLAELENEQKELGYITDFWVSQTSPMPNVGDTDGLAWRIEGVEVKGTQSEYGGTLCAEGRRYISALFARGVHIDLIQ